jgi:biopolymer transport protein ExbB
LLHQVARGLFIVLLVTGMGLGSGHAQTTGAPIAQPVQTSPRPAPSPSQLVPASPQTPVAQSAPVARDPAAIEPALVPGSSSSDVAAGPAQAIGKPQREMSPWSMFLSADILVKVVMVSLAFASLVTWTIFLAKSVQLSHARRKLAKALGRIAETRTLSEAQLALGSKNNVLSAFLVAAMHEVRMSANSATDSGIKERAASRFTEITRVEARAVRYGMATLATIGATSPFVGLFGTVWGIMNSFIGISKAQTTNLAVVAPGIAEALLATAIGLVAAIPAVIIYNHFSRLTKGYIELVGRGSGAVGRLLSRDLDRVQGRISTRAAE